jgi:Zinc carboxypeptidase
MFFSKHYFLIFPDVPGSSQIPCTDTYAGPRPYSEPEVKALIDFYDTFYQDSWMYLTFHSAAQMLLYPWGTTSTYENITNLNDLVRKRKKYLIFNH